MSIETLSTIISAASLLVAMAGGFAWTIHRSDARADRTDARVDALRSEMDQRFDRVERDLTEVKVAVARLEGPLPRLITAR